MTVFGFNTDIRYGDTVYHVQTEAHENDHTVLTAIFVRGRCLDKHKMSYARDAAAPGFSEGHIHQLLTRQHKFVLNCIREGKIESLLNMGTSAAALSGDGVSGDDACQDSSCAAVASPAAQIVEPVSDVHQSSDRHESDVLELPVPPVVPSVEPEPEPLPLDIPELKLEWLAPRSVCNSDSVLMRYRLTKGSSAVNGAKIIARLEVASVPSAYSRTMTNDNGEAEVSFALGANVNAADQLSITVQALHAGQSVARRFRLNRS